MLRAFTRNINQPSPLNGLPMLLIKLLLRRSEGQDLIEYALLASFVSCVAVAVLSSLGLKVSGRLDNIGTAISATGAPGGSGSPGSGSPGSGSPGSGSPGSGSGSGSGSGTGSGNTGSGNGNGNGNGNKKG
jgi:Flp pilus assembly pilin Flp